MARPASEILTEREAQIMEVLWSRGAATADEVRIGLGDNAHDSTVRTLLRILKNKGYVRTKGRQPKVYEPRMAREQAQSKAAASLLERFFGGAAKALVLRLLEDESLTPAQLDELRQRLVSNRQIGDK